MDTIKNAECMQKLVATEYYSEAVIYISQCIVTEDESVKQAIVAAIKDKLDE